MNRKVSMLCVSSLDIAEFYGFIRGEKKWYHPAGECHFSPHSLAGWYWSYKGLLELNDVFKPTWDSTTDPVWDEVFGPFDTELECIRDIRRENESLLE